MIGTTRSRVSFFMNNGQNITSIDGTPPQRASIQQWESLERYNAYRKSAAFADARKIGEQYAKFRTFAIEGMPQ